MSQALDVADTGARPIAPATGGGGFTILRQFVAEFAIRVPDGLAAFEPGGFSVAPRVSLRMTPYWRGETPRIAEVHLRLEVDARRADDAARVVYLLAAEPVALVALAAVADEAVEAVILRDVVRTMYPALRAMVARATVEAGVPSLLLEPMGETLTWHSALDGRPTL